MTSTPSTDGQTEAAQSEHPAKKAAEMRAANPADPPPLDGRDGSGVEEREEEPSDSSDAADRPETEATDSQPPGAQRPLDPPKLVRLANLAREVLEEVRQMTPQESTVRDLADLYRRVEDQLKEALPEPLAEELEAMDLDLPFEDGASQEEVRIALSGLTGWLGGLFQGLHASLLAAAPVLELPPEAGRPGAMPPGPVPHPRAGLQPAGPRSAEERKGEGYL